MEEMEACLADKTCRTLHEELQVAMKKDGGYGGKDGDDKYDDKPKVYKPDYSLYGGEKKGIHVFAGGTKGNKASRRRQLDRHLQEKQPVEKGDMKEYAKGKYKAKPEGGKMDMGDKKDLEQEPSAELKAAMKACTENTLCKELMECKTKHKESGGCMFTHVFCLWYHVTCLVL